MQQIDFMNVANHKHLLLVEKQPKPSFRLIFADVICLHVAFTNSPNIEMELTNKSTQNAKFDIGNRTKLPSNNASKICKIYRHNLVWCGGNCFHTAMLFKANVPFTVKTL